MFSSHLLLWPSLCMVGPTLNQIFYPPTRAILRASFFHRGVQHNTKKNLGILVEPETEVRFHRLNCCHSDFATDLTIAASHDVKVQLRVLGIEAVESLNEVPELTGDLPLTGDVTMGIGHVGEPSTCWLVDVQQVGS